MDPYLIPYININSKGIKDQNVKIRVIKSTEANIQANFHDIDFGNNIIDRTAKVQLRNENTNKLNYIKIFKYVHYRTLSRQ